jgi:lysophospholipase L1-like esterase
MSRASRARKIATAAAYGGGGLGALGALGAASLVGVILGESKLARRRIPQAFGDAPPTDGTIWTAAGVSSSHATLDIGVLGDSLAAGYGVSHLRETSAARIAVGISAAARRPVRVVNAAFVGAESPDLAKQVENLGEQRLDLAVIIVGANDVTHRIKPADSVRYLEQAVRGLTERGVEVVVGTCPDLGAIRPLAQPLRAYARRLSRNLAAAQTIAVVQAGGRTVSLGDLLGPLFADSPDFFAEDQFHPNAAGYAAAAEAMLPSCLDALGLATRAKSASTFTTRMAKPLARAAAQAAARPGSEVAPVAESEPVTGRRRLRRGPWARLRRRQQVDERPTPEISADVSVADVS